MLNQHVRVLLYYMGLNGTSKNCMMIPCPNIHSIRLVHVQKTYRCTKVSVTDT